MLKRLFLILAVALSSAAQSAHRTLSVLIIDGINNHDWAAATRAIRSTLEGTGRFRVDVCTWPQKPDFARYDVVVNNFNGGHLPDGVRWPRETELALEKYVRDGGGLVIFHAANNAFLQWPEYNEMIGLGWRDKSFGPGLAVVQNKVVTVPQGSGLDPGHGPRHDFELFVLDKDHPITRGLPAHWTHPAEQLTHGQHGPAHGLTVLTYAYSEVSRQGEPMDWIRQYGKGRVYTTMLGHTWKDEPNPNLDDVSFQALFARGTEWAATGTVTLPADLGWKSLMNGKDLEGWEPRGECIWTVMKDGVLLGQRTHPEPSKTWPIDEKTYRNWASPQAWLYTNRDFGQFDLHLEYWLPPGGNSGVSIRDRSRAHYAIREPDSVHPELVGPVHSTPAHIGYEVQILDDDRADYPSGSVYLFNRAKTGVHRSGDWNSMDIESRNNLIRVRLNGEIVSESPGDPARSRTGPIGLQLHDRFSFILFRNLRIREIR
ncbi:MAG TPA: family 16 glycoside hydrolase [Bryobacteraceae bacterium]|nr:family 16 glycoside hydrolase [Bryobacteraceae bacterium]